MQKFFCDPSHTTFVMNTLRPGDNPWEAPYYQAEVYDVVRFPSGDNFGFLRRTKC